ncbi:hypothetical protein J1605_013813 [Eschrichtius robustus]|uniref:Uncharacterized protein n=1 Tax=Eschrichtius robustus TaxID=9764 RepID=A0AB34GF32_ESCRO|nr:hypothetical protein J1605_013813 [Eschrichtius robustus]
MALCSTSRFGKRAKLKETAATSGHCVALAPLGRRAPRRTSQSRWAESLAGWRRGLAGPACKRGCGTRPSLRSLKGGPPRSGFFHLWPSLLAELQEWIRSETDDRSYESDAKPLAIWRRQDSLRIYGTPRRHAEAACRSSVTERMRFLALHKASSYSFRSLLSMERFARDLLCSVQLVKKEPTTTVIIAWSSVFSFALISPGPNA